VLANISEAVKSGAGLAHLHFIFGKPVVDLPVYRLSVGADKCFDPHSQSREKLAPVFGWDNGRSGFQVNLIDDIGGGGDGAEQPPLAIEFIFPDKRLFDLSNESGMINASM
jgi:hypothetical protein